MYHRLGIPLSIKTISQTNKYIDFTFYKSRDDNDTLLLFVHGFSGDSEKTWLGLKDCIMNDSFFSKSDIIFYGYDSIFTQINNSGIELFNFLNEYLSDSENTILKYSNSPRKISLNIKEYNKIILVGHSLGTILIRLALYFSIVNSLKKGQNTWLPNTKAIFYAPAHCGGYSADSIVEFLKSISKDILSNFALNFSKFVAPVVHELKTDSKFIASLKYKVNEIKNIEPQRNLANHIFPKKIFWAEKELVVFNDIFDIEDALPEYVYGKTHTTICKAENQTDIIFKSLKKSIL